MQDKLFVTPEYVVAEDIKAIRKKLAIEFNGDYWHSDVVKDKYYHQRKTVACSKLGIRLIHIFEYEWLDSNIRNKIKGILCSLLTNNKTILHGRDVKVMEISNSEAKEFAEKYHLSGGVNSNINIGCIYNNEIVGILTFGKPRFGGQCEYELYRLCWKPDVVISGGFERMFRDFERRYTPTSIVTYTNIAKFTGTSYAKVGFSLVKELTEPNYVWVQISQRGHKIMPRYQTQKHLLIEAGYGHLGSTEKEIMENLGYARVYDCGNFKLEWRKSDSGS